MSNKKENYVKYLSLSDVFLNKNWRTIEYSEIEIGEHFYCKEIAKTPLYKISEWEYYDIEKRETKSRHFEKVIQGKHYLTEKGKKTWDS